MTDQPAGERQLLREAMDRLLAGKPIRSDGSLHAVTVIAEAGEQFKRHHLTHKHRDLLQEFYARVAAQGGVPESEQKLTEALRQAREDLQQLKDDNDDLTAQVRTLSRMNNVLAVENAALRSAGGLGATVTALHGRADTQPR